MYNAKIIADSISPFSKRLTTFIVTYPRIVHAEMCRHRMHSRNTASSRAIPFSKMVKEVEENPFIPIAWQKSHKGMQGSEYFDDYVPLIIHWEIARDKAIETAKTLNKQGVTKQLCNRLLEPFVWVTEIITGTEWANFFELRCPQYVVNWYSSQKNKTEIFRSRKEVINHVEENNLKNGWENCRNWDDNQWLQINNSQAEIHIQKIAEMMWDARNESTPKQLKAGEWHIPFGDNFDDGKLRDMFWIADKNPDPSYVAWQKEKVKIATARCARLSYATLGDNPKIDYEADIRLHDKLASMKHWSPFEHCARAMTEYEFNSHHRGIFVPYGDDNKDEVGMALDSNSFGWCGNLQGWINYRNLIEP